MESPGSNRATPVSLFSTASLTFVHTCLGGLSKILWRRMRTFLAVKHANGEGNQAFNLQYMKEWLELLEFQQKILRIGRLKAFNVISTQILNESLIYSIRGCFVIFATHFKHLLFAGERIYEIKKGRGGGSTEPKLKEVGVTFLTRLISSN